MFRLFFSGTRAPFSVNFISDSFEAQDAAINGEAIGQDPGFTLGFTMDSINC